LLTTVQTADFKGSVSNFVIMAPQA